MSSSRQHTQVPLNPRSCYPERKDPEERLADRIGNFLEWEMIHRWRTNARNLENIVSLAEKDEPGFRAISNDSLQEVAQDLRTRLRRSGFQEDVVARSFALIREAADRTLGLRHYRTQLMCGWALLGGRVAEMATGEGKSLCATLPACTAALAGMKVHVITVNDYLVCRDAAYFKPLYDFLGLTTGHIAQGMEPGERQAAYSCDITYCNNKELVFDYLKDRIALGNLTSKTHLQIEKLSGGALSADRLLLQGLQFAIVDEADSVLIDEARTPLIISEERDSIHKQQMFQHALDISAELREDTDYQLGDAFQPVRLTDEGKLHLAGICAGLDGLWGARRSREELVTQALLARHRFFKDQHYLVTDGKVEIIDEYTGRLMPDRSWEGGLHQMIETKEGCEITKNRETIARITYQRFFRRYLLLSGMTGTAAEVAGELWSVYGMRMVRIPTLRPVQRKYFTAQIHPTMAAKWSALVAHVSDMQKNEGRPVLVGTRSVEASETVSALFAKAGLRHHVLNARQDAQEAEIIKNAGEAGQITIATNMAGRGTDIILGKGVADKGGLHVVLTEWHDARRIDRQLFGRCSRQGDPGSCVAIISLEDEILTAYHHQVPAFLRTAMALIPKSKGTFGKWQLRAAQQSAERLHARMRRQTLESQKKLDRMLAFTGRVE
jgi:preprotein translocase subunit SecA